MGLWRLSKRLWRIKSLPRPREGVSYNFSLRYSYGLTRGYTTNAGCSHFGKPWNITRIYNFRFAVDFVINNSGLCLEGRNRRGSVSKSGYRNNTIVVRKDVIRVTGCFVSPTTIFLKMRGIQNWGLSGPITARDGAWRNATIAEVHVLRTPEVFPIVFMTYNV
jgi:hypothetical protein